MLRNITALALLLGLTAQAVGQTTTTTMPIRDGSSGLRQMRAEQGVDGSLATHTVPEPIPLTPNSSLVFPSSISGSSTPLFTGGLALKTLIVFNNNLQGGAYLWCNPSGGTAVPGAGVPVAPGGAYSWDSGLTTVPNCIPGTQIGGTTASPVLISGSGG